jgi:hypothetical protein
VKNHLEEFVRQFKYALASRQMFKWAQSTPSETLTDIQRAARFFYLQQQAFGGKVEGQTWGTATTAPAINLLRIEENLSAAHLRLAGAYVEHLPWDQCFDRYDRPHTLFYADPPYWETEGYGVAFDWAQVRAAGREDAAGERQGDRQPQRPPGCAPVLRGLPDGDAADRLHGGGRRQARTTQRVDHLQLGSGG